MSSTTLRILSAALFCVLLVLDTTITAQDLEYGFYQHTCPSAEYIVKKTTITFVTKKPTLAAGLLRMHFHDCFVKGCDGSILLNPTSETRNPEKTAIPNLSLRGYEVIDAAKAEIEKACPGVVSCADILALAARDATAMISGPFWHVQTGRRDGQFSRVSDALANLPCPFANISSLKQSFQRKGLTVKDLAVLSGAHTIGIGHCPTFRNRLYNFSGKGDSDPKLDRFYALKLMTECKPGDLTSSVEMDPGSFKTFDNSYYKLVTKRRGLFQSDAALLDDSETKAYVNSQAISQGSTFFADFAESMVKMGRLEVLTGNDGEIRQHCAFVNPNRSFTFRV